MILKCPHCDAERESEGNAYRPFCSERCKLLDLGSWISETYRIQQKTEDEDEDGDAFHEKDPGRE